MYTFNNKTINSSVPPYSTNPNFFSLKNMASIKKDTREQNKYFSFDKSIHSTLAAFNQVSTVKNLSLDTLYKLFKDNWVSAGYSSTAEEIKFYNKGRTMLFNYFIKPLDKGVDSLIINKVLTMQIQSKISVWARIDKVFEHEDGSIEIVDYKTGKIINHTHNFTLDLRSILYALLIHNKLNLLPICVSYYYLSYNKKFTHIIYNEDIPQLYDCLYRFLYKGMRN